MSATDVTTVESGPRVISRRVTVQAAPAQVFALVSDPYRHPELDGSGTLRAATVKGPHQLGQGAAFSVGMKLYGLPYRIRSTVTEYEQDRLITWRHPLGHYWSWALSPAADGGTEVTETWSYGSSVLAPVFELGRFHIRNAAGITTTLRQLATRFS